jgi:hypothetical protein
MFQLGRKMKGATAMHDHDDDEDQVPIPGALISGQVTFSDGQDASWSLDRTGHLGLSGPPKSYMPPKQDIPSFQEQLDLLLQQVEF